MTWYLVLILIVLIIIGCVLVIGGKLWVLIIIRCVLVIEVELLLVVIISEYALRGMGRLLKWFRVFTVRVLVILRRLIRGGVCVEGMYLGKASERILKADRFYWRVGV